LDFIQQIVNGIIIGSQYSLIALGLTVVYGIFGVINLGYGGVFMIGAFVAYYAVSLVTTQVSCHKGTKTPRL